jgi:hypothetical protein
MLGSGIIKTTCPACGKQTEAVVRDGKVSGYYAISNEFVSFKVDESALIEQSVKPKKIEATLPTRDIKGRFIKKKSLPFRH